ncbi:CheR family methyltransferase [Chitinimonas lacunae]|uniref:Chemotaxis protein methyltransferase n=1 Tax=Chitinimonas lacunae TaxID=1963018 RepID=A0ABV8MQL0_9NEIS
MTQWPFEPMNDREFEAYSGLIERLVGIHLTPLKRAMVSGRLSRRLRELGVASFGDYFRLIDDGGDAAERQVAIDLVTTNETHFFREPKHFELLKQRLLPSLDSKTLRVWSAACSSGEEAYSIAMVMADVLGEEAAWEVFGSDVSLRMLQMARRALYPLDRARELPLDYLRRYCLRGTGEYAGTLLVERALRRHTQFARLNLIEPLPEIGRFDLIFLRNVIIYFDADTKRRVVGSVASRLRPGGWLVVGHAESLIDVPPGLGQVLPTVYRKGGA